MVISPSCVNLRQCSTSIKTLSSYLGGVDTTYPGPAHLSIGQEAACVGQAYTCWIKTILISAVTEASGEILAKSLSCIHKMSESTLMEIMEHFIGGETLRATEKMGSVDDVKEFGNSVHYLRYTL